METPPPIPLRKTSEFRNETWRRRERHSDLQVFQSFVLFCSEIGFQVFQALLKFAI